MSLGPAERRFLLGAVLERRVESIAGLDWQAIAARARSLGITGLAWHATAGAAGGAGAEALRREAIRDAAQTTLTLHAFARVSRMLAAAGLDCMALKGVALVADDPAFVPLRHVSDLDLLVRVRDVEASDAALVRGGLRRLARRPTLEGEAGLGAAAAHEAVSGIANYLGEDGVAIDLHVRPPSASVPGGEDGLWERSRAIPALETRLRVPSRGDLLLIAADHVLEHHGGEPALLPRHVADLGRLLRLGALEAIGRPPPRSLSVSLEIRREAEAAFEGKTALPWPGRLERSLVPALADLEGAFRRTAYRGRVRARLLSDRGWSALLPSRAYLAASYGAPEGAWWLPLLHVRRLLWDQPLRILGRRARVRTGGR